MTRTLAVLIGLVVARCAGAAGAAVWTCDQRTEIFTGQAYLVTARCTAAGNYSSGGDAPPNPGMDLCNSSARHPTAVFVTSAVNLGAGQAYVAVFDLAGGKFVLATSGASPGPGSPLIQLAPGPIDGAVLRTLSVCQ